MSPIITQDAHIVLATKCIKNIFLFLLLIYENKLNILGLWKSKISESVIFVLEKH